MGKLVMGYWDCPYCSTKHIEGTRRECPSCGKPRGQEVKFYMDGVRYLSEEESQTKGKGADWLCDHCGNYNSALNTRCSSCGAAAAVLNEVRRIRGILTSGKSRTQEMPGMHQVQEWLPADKKAGRAIGKEDIHLVL